MSGAGNQDSKDAFLRKAGPLVLVRLLGAGITFFIPLVLARLLIPEDFGTYKLLFLVGNTLYYVLPFGMAQSLYYFVPRTQTPRPYFFQSLCFLLGMGILACAVLVLGSGAVAGWLNNSGVATYRWPLGIYTGALIGSCSLELMMTSRGRTGRSALMYLTSDLLRTGALVVPVVLGYGVAGLMVAMAGFAVLRLVAAWALVLSESSGHLFDRKLLSAQFVYAAPFGAAMALNMPQQYAHQFVVSGSVTKALFALYSVGCFQLPLVELLYTPTSEMLMVRLGELKREGRLEEGVEAFRQATAKLAFAFFPMCVFLFAAAPEFIGALFGTNYLGAVPIFRVSVVAIALASFPLDGTLRACGETRHLFLSYFIKAAVTVPLVYLLVRSFGMMGGIVSWLLAELVGKITLLVRIPRALSTPSATVRLVDLMPWPALGKALGAAVGGGALVLFLRGLGDGTLHALPEGLVWRAVPLMVAAALFSAGYLLSLRLTGVRPVDAVAAFLRRRPA